MKPITTFQTKSGKEIEIWEPAMERFLALLEFYRRLTDEDTFINRYDSINPKVEKRKLESKLSEIRNNNTCVAWAMFDQKIVGLCNMDRVGGRSWHIGKIGLMIDKDFRRDGIGEDLARFIIEKARKMQIKIVTLEVFAENESAIALYQKLGFREYGRLKNGLFRKNKYSDAILMSKEL